MTSPFSNFLNWNGVLMGIFWDGWVWLPASRRCCSNLGLSPAWAAVAWSIARCSKLWPPLHSDLTGDATTIWIRWNITRWKLLISPFQETFNITFAVNKPFAPVCRCAWKKLLSVLKGFFHALACAGPTQKIGACWKIVFQFFLRTIGHFRKGLYIIWWISSICALWGSVDLGSYI